MQQQISLITLGIKDVARSRRFYSEGFGWTPVFEHEDVTFYQMNGLILCTWPQSKLADDMNRTGLQTPGACALAHNVKSQEEVEAVIAHLTAHGGRLLRKADAPPHGGIRGYIADPDDHTWEIAWHPAFRIDDDGRVTFVV